jgi:hypothetical protein
MERKTRLALSLTAAAIAATVGQAPAFADCTSGWAPGTSSTDMNAAIRWLTLWDPDGAGPVAPVLAAAGDFTSAGIASASQIATWDGSNWSALGSGLNGPGYCLTSLSSTNQLFVAGTNFSNAGGTPARRVARWDGGTWYDLATGSGTTPSLTLLTVTALNPTTVVVTGAFTSIGQDDNVVPANRVAAWSASTGWYALGAGMSSTTSAAITMPNGDLIVGGAGLTTGDGSLTVNRIARWDGTAWHDLAGGVNGLVRCFAIASNGDLIVGGAFTMAGTTPANRIARWNGTAWSALGDGTSGATPDVYALVALPNGDIIAAGDFSTAGTTPANRIARWNGSTWSALGSGLNAVVRAAALLPNGDIAVGGDFTQAGGQPALRFATYASQSPALITAEPSSQAPCPSGSATFDLTATGSGLTYQWQQQDLLNLPDFVNIDDGLVFDPFGNTIATATGAHTGHLVLSDLQGVAQIFRCVVSNSCSSDTSTEVTLSFCPADFDCSGVLAVADIFEFLNGWFAGVPAADFDHADGLQVADIFAFLNAWFEGC